MKGAVLIVAVLALCPLGCKAAVPQKPLVFSVVAPGIEHALFDAASDKASSGPAFAGHAFLVDLKKTDVHVIPAGAPGDRRVVDVITSALPFHLATNASFFDESNKAMGRVMDDGKVLVNDKRGAWGALVIDAQLHQARVVLGDPAPTGDVVVQGIPRLVVDGTVQKLKPAVAERTAVCAEGSTLIIVVAGKADTGDFARFLALPREKGGLGCTDALNLDGGPSTQLDAVLPGLKLGQKGGWGVPNALVVVPRDPSPNPTATAP